MQFLIVTLFMIALTKSAVWSVIQPDDAHDALPQVDPEEGIQEERKNTIAPGTKWCGNGNRSLNNEDLGWFRTADACCREHDRCDDYILAGATKHNLTNPDKYSRLHCKCDQKFYECLKHRPLNLYAILTGKVYFSWNRLFKRTDKCFKEEYPIVGCKTYQGWFRIRCIEYDVDTSKDMIWQWFDVPMYKLFG